MKLSELKQQGVAGDGKEKWVERIITYKGKNEAGEETEYRGAVMVRVIRWKDSKAVADLGAKFGDNVAAGIHQNIRFDGGKETVPIEAIDSFSTSLIDALLTAIAQVNPLPDLGKV